MKIILSRREALKIKNLSKELSDSQVTDPFINTQVMNVKINENDSANYLEVNIREEYAYDVLDLLDKYAGIVVPQIKALVKAYYLLTDEATALDKKYFSKIDTIS